MGCFPRVWTWHIYTQGSAEYFFGLNFENLYIFRYWSQLLYFLGLLSKSCILKCFIFSTVFFGVQSYSPSASIIMGLLFGKWFFWVFCQWQSISWVFQKYPTPLILVCRFFKSTPWGCFLKRKIGHFLYSTTT